MVDFDPRNTSKRIPTRALYFFLLLLAVGAYYFYRYCHLHAPLDGVATRIVAYEEDYVPDCAPLPSQPQWNDSREGWRKIDPGSGWYVYSAHLDRRPKVPLVRIVALAKNATGAPLFCQIWTGEGTFSVVRAQQRELWIRAWDSAQPGQYYCPFLLSCQVPPQSRYPVFVSVVAEPCGQPSHRIAVTPPQSRRGEFAVCLKTLDFKQDVGQRLLEWLELQHLLGADSVCAYVHEVHPSSKKVLEHYERTGRLTLRNHTLPGQGTGGLWQKRRHEMAIYNDCFYRHLDSHRFVVNLDLDEAIVPVARYTWTELMADHHHSPAASLSARCVYFFDSLGEEDPSIPPSMHMLRHVYRSSAFAPPGFAQKSFFSTLHAEVVSNHFALRAVSPDVRLLSGLDVTEARLHHYRRGCPALMERECDQNYMKFRQRDTLLWKYKEELLRNVQQRTRELDDADLAGNMNTNSTS